MKKLFLLLAACGTLTALHAQIINPKDAVKNAGSNRANSEIQNGADNAVNSVDNRIKGLFHKKKKADAAPAEQQAATTTATTAAPAPTGGAGFKAYSNYDFVPGTRIIFEDHFADDQDGEFPSHWNLGAGQAGLSIIAGQEALCLTDGNYAHVSPLIKGATYLTDTFTIEFDAYTTEGYGIKMYLYSNTANALAASGVLGQVNFNSGPSTGSVEASAGETVSLAGDVPSDIKGEVAFNKWHHYAVAYRHHQLKVYEDQYRILTVPNMPITPGAFDIEGIGDKSNPIIMTNFRVANGGGMNQVGHKFTDAKIVTHGINFDIDKATIKPESMGTLNMIVQVLKDNPDLRFEVDGHTDNSGAVAHNALLSQQRADAVKAQLITMGVAAGRLTTKGFGDTKPISDNSTPEGKANNRRVEFVRL